MFLFLNRRFECLILFCFCYSLLQPTPQVRLSTKQNLSFYSTKPLSLSKCHNLANHYLGFCGWTTRIITVSTNMDDIH